MFSFESNGKLIERDNLFDDVKVAYVHRIKAFSEHFTLRGNDVQLFYSLNL